MCPAAPDSVTGKNAERTTSLSLAAVASLAIEARRLFLSRSPRIGTLGKIAQVLARNHLALVARHFEQALADREIFRIPVVLHIFKREVAARLRRTESARTVIIVETRKPVRWTARAVQRHQASIETIERAAAPLAAEDKEAPGRFEVLRRTLALMQHFGQIAAPVRFPGFACPPQQDERTRKILHPRQS